MSLGWEGACRESEVSAIPSRCKWYAQRGSRKILQSGRDEPSGSSVRVAVRIEFHGKAAFEIVLGGDCEDFCDIHRYDCARGSGGGILDVRDGVSMGEHLIEAAESVFGGKCGKAITEVGERVKPRAVDAIQETDDEERIFADGIVVFEMDDDIFGSGIISDGLQRFGKLRDIKFRVLSLRDIGAHAGRTEVCRDVNPALRELRGAFTFRGVWGIDAVFAVGGDVGEGAPGLCGGVAELIEVGRFQRLEVFAPRFDSLDVEFAGDVCGEVLERHLFGCR